MPTRHVKHADSLIDGAAGDAPGRGLLKERAYAEIKRLILDGEIPPGTFLAERQLAGRLGMSKTPVRSALEKLETEGFVSISPQQGAIVRDISVREIADQYEIRSAIESFVARNVAGRLTPVQVREVRDNLDEQRKNLLAGDVERGVALDEQFHGFFCEALGNQEILKVMGQLHDKVHRVITQVFKTNPSRLAGSCEEHVAIAEAIFLGDADLAASRVEGHLRYGLESLLSPRRP